MFEYYKNFTLRCINDSKVSTETFPLAFLNFDTKDDSYVKRKKTVDNWASFYEYTRNESTGKVDSKYILTPEHEYNFVNDPVTGFRVSRSVSRVSTDNKWIEIADPRGFSLQISTANFCDLISKTTIINGVFQDALVWVKDGQKVNLALLDDLMVFDPFKYNAKDLQAGMQIIIGKETEPVLYLGQMNYLLYKISSNPARRNNVNWWSEQILNRDGISSDHIFLCGNNFRVMSSKPKKFKIVDIVDGFDVSLYKEQFREYSYDGYAKITEKDTINNNDISTIISLWKIINLKYERLDSMRLIHEGNILFQGKDFKL